MCVSELESRFSSSSPYEKKFWQDSYFTRWPCYRYLKEFEEWLCATHILLAVWFLAHSPSPPHFSTVVGILQKAGRLQSTRYKMVKKLKDEEADTDDLHLERPNIYK